MVDSYLFSSFQSLYAFSLPVITPTIAPIPAPAGISPNPYAAGAAARGVKRPLDDQNFLWGNMNGNKKGKADGSHGPPPASYTCHKCKEPGVSPCKTLIVSGEILTQQPLPSQHWIQDCPLRAQSSGCRKCGSFQVSGNGGIELWDAVRILIPAALSMRLEIAPTQSQTGHPQRATSASCVHK